MEKFEKDMDWDLVSIVLPVYNGEEYIDACIESLEKQTYHNIEIIFVDDGSTDNTRQKIENFQKKYKNIRYYYQKNNKQGAARNNGLRKANGKYVCFIDSDDFIDENMIYDMHEKIITEDYDIVLCDYYISDKKENRLVKCYNEPYKDDDHVELKEYLVSTLSPCNKMFKKDFLLKNNFLFLEGVIYEDFACIPTLVKYSPKICYIPKPYNYYVQTDNSTVRNSGYKENYEDIFVASEYLYQSLKDYSDFHEELEFIFIYHLLHNASILFNQFGKNENIYKISEFIKKNFPKWYNNKYLKKENWKFKIICYLFYKKKIKLINTVRKWKKKYGQESSEKKV